MPFMSSAYPCSFWEYASFDLERSFAALTTMFPIETGLVVLAIFGLPPFVGHLLDRRRASV
jgi:hypothetical protein